MEFGLRFAALIYLEVAPGVVRFYRKDFFVTFVIFCANDFSLFPPATKTGKKAKAIFEQKIAKITKSHCL